MSYKVLPGFEDTEIARNFLKRLAKDRGIAGVMKKHKWTVPVLSEMYPSGKVQHIAQDCSLTGCFVSRSARTRCV